MQSEKEKMLAGQLYFAGDSELVKERNSARHLLSAYNATKPEEIEHRNQILNRLLKFTGEIKIEPPFYCDYGYNIRLGNNFYANFSCIMLDVNNITIGNNVLLGPYVQIYTATHPLQAEERIKGPEFAKPIVIGDNVWIGGGAILLPGISIGHNTTIGAGSVVTKDVPDDVFAAGNPCKVIKKL